MRFGDLNWLYVILLFAGMFFLRRCGLGGCCSMTRFHKRMDHASNNPDAIDILNKRYANGEIDSEEYKRKKDEILGR